MKKQPLKNFAMLSLLLMLTAACVGNDGELCRKERSSPRCGFHRRTPLTEMRAVGSSRARAD